MVNAVNNGLVFSLQREDSAPVSLGVPVDIIRNMLAFASTESPPDFKTFTLVCRKWREIVLGKEFYQERYHLIAPHLFGKADYVKYVGGDSGPELPIPLEYVVKFRPGETLLTFSPKEVAFTQADGTVLVKPRTMVNMEQWALNAKEGHPMGYHPRSMQPAIVEARPFEDSHWSFIEIGLIEKSKVFAEQESAVLARSKKIVGLSDLSLSLLMAYVKTGVRHLNWGETDFNFQMARVPETTQGWRICVGFAAAGLSIRPNLVDAESGSIGVVVGRQFFG